MMTETGKLKLVTGFIFLYLAGFGLYALVSANMEFFYYSFIIILIAGFILLYYRKFELPIPLIIILALLGLLNVLGGSLYFGEIRLYDMRFSWCGLRYDNIMHLLTAFTTVLVAFSFLKYSLHQKLFSQPFNLGLLLVLIALGFGSFTEIIELGAVLFFNATQRVGDYYNNAWDQVFNGLGGIIGAAFVYFYLLKKQRIKK